MYIKPRKIARLLSKKRVCNGTCKKFHVSKPTGKGRYESGQARCQTCDIWIDHNGCHLNDGSSATEDSLGWFCNCCKYRVRRHPRNKIYKEKLRAKQDSNVQEQDEVDVSSLNMLIEKTLHKIKSAPKGAYLNDLRMLLDISQEEMSTVVTRVIRVEGISKKEICHQEILQDILFTYHEPEYTDDTGADMVDELEHKFEVEIKQKKDKQKLQKEIREELKKSGMMDEKGKLKLKGISPKTLKRMKQEFVECPVLDKDIQFIQCFLCPNFQSRVKGKVLCKGDKLQ